jgi:ApbE superfamily uncharacterized protein (UPF0280 family)
MFYRNNICTRFNTFDFSYRFTDGSLGISECSKTKQEILTAVKETVAELYTNLDRVIKNNPVFKTSFNPVSLSCNNKLISQMVNCAKEANVGPMAGVAGTFANAITNKLSKITNECYFENGGDISLVCKKNTNISLFKGPKNDAPEISLCLPPGNWGIASSSGKTGRSISLGIADMVSVVTECPIKADCFATAIANKVQLGVDIEKLINGFNRIEAIAIFFNNKFYYKGIFQLGF